MNNFVISPTLQSKQILQLEHFCCVFISVKVSNILLMNKRWILGLGGVTVINCQFYFTFSNFAFSSFLSINIKSGLFKHEMFKMNWNGSKKLNNRGRLLLHLSKVKTIWKSRRNKFMFISWYIHRLTFIYKKD